MMSCVLRAMRALNSVGSAMASSSALVCSDCVPPNTAAMAFDGGAHHVVVGSCSVSDQPEVWQCAQHQALLGFLALKPSLMRHHSRRAARILATSR